MRDLDVIECAQDARSLQSALLLIEEALETGTMPKSFLIFNDEFNDKSFRTISILMRDKYNIEVPECNT